MGRFLTTDLGLYVQDTSPARIRHVSDSHEAGAVKIAGKLSVFDERAIGNHLLELFLSDEVVVLAIDFSWTW